MNNNFILVLLFICCQISYSQSKKDINEKEIEENDIFSILYEENDSVGLINIYQDYRIEKLVLQHIEQNKRYDGIQGYRINIFFESGLYARQSAVAVQDTFRKYYPYIPSYLKFHTPNFKVYVGDFRTKAEALKFHKRIRRRYPKSFIIKDLINYPRID